MAAASLVVLACGGVGWIVAAPRPPAPPTRTTPVLEPRQGVGTAILPKTSVASRSLPRSVGAPAPPEATRALEPAADRAPSGPDAGVEHTPGRPLRRPRQR